MKIQRSSIQRSSNPLRKIFRMSFSGQALIRPGQALIRLGQALIRPGQPSKSQLKTKVHIFFIQQFIYNRVYTVVIEIVPLPL